jgi:hypothetical protein
VSAEGLTEGRPDPAVADPRRPGLRAHQHPPNQLHPWVFMQHQVWVDYWGNEHEIESIDADYAANIIRFCEAQATRIALIVAMQLAAELCAAVPEEVELSTEMRGHLLGEDAVIWLQETPLIRALKRRARREASAGESGGGDS